MGKKVKKNLIELSQKWTFYKIRGTNYTRQRFGNEEDYVKGKHCELCNVSLGSYHLMGCEEEQSVCSKCPGKNIDCNCDGEGVDD